jgi:hypothetical protein
MSWAAAQSAGQMPARPFQGGPAVQTAVVIKQGMPSLKHAHLPDGPVRISLSVWN